MSLTSWTLTDPTPMTEGSLMSPGSQLVRSRSVPTRPIHAVCRKGKSGQSRDNCSGGSFQASSKMHLSTAKQSAQRLIVIALEHFGPGLDHLSAPCPLLPEAPMNSMPASCEPGKPLKDWIRSPELLWCIHRRLPSSAACMAFHEHTPSRSDRKVGQVRFPRSKRQDAMSSSAQYLWSSCTQARWPTHS
jgi:hypothetical protein